MSVNTEVATSDDQSKYHDGRSVSAAKKKSNARVYKRFMGILPAFRHVASGETHLSCEKDGSLAPTHQVDSLPGSWLLCNLDNTECKLKDNIEKGYVVMGHFFNQHDAAQLLPH